jgi:DNA repair exonuclease SbcCD ATPase subunit
MVLAQSTIICGIVELCRLAATSCLRSSNPPTFIPSVSSKQSPILKHWLATGSVAFVTSCGCSLPFTQNLPQSLLFGMAAVPGVAVSTIVKSRQRKQQINRQLERGKSRLHQLQQRSGLLDRQLLVKGKERQAIEIRVAQLHTVAAELKAQINTDRQQYQQLEQELALAAIYCQEQQLCGEKLDRKIQEKQARSLEVDTELNQLKVDISRLQFDKNQLATATDRAKISLSNIQSEIERCTAIKQELALEIQQLQPPQPIDSNSFARSLEQQNLIQALELVISERQQIKTDLTLTIDRLEQKIAEKSVAANGQSQKLVEIGAKLSATELALTAKQAQLEELSAQVLVKYNDLQKVEYVNEAADILTEQLTQRELKIADLELSSRRAELENLDLKIQSRRQEITRIDTEPNLQTFEPKPPLVSRSIEPAASEGEWYDKFIDNPHLSVLQHIEKHGTITEAEASSKLGNARSVRQFANKLAEYTQDLPFSIRVESSPKGNRYLKENQS